MEVNGYHYHTNIPLYGNDNDPSADAPVFLALSRGPEIDVGALRMGAGTALPAALDASFLDPQAHARTVKLAVAQMCFVVGYPEGLFIRESDRAVLPIWKTGHIAAEPSVYIDGVPKFLIDAATRPGMSGCPVFVREKACNRLLGIYTGRTSNTSDLGYVFSPEILIQLISETS